MFQPVAEYFPTIGDCWMATYTAEGSVEDK